MIYDSGSVGGNCDSFFVVHPSSVKILGMGRAVKPVHGKETIYY